MYEQIQHIEPAKLTTDLAVQQVMHLLLNIVEGQAARIDELEQKNQELESEIKRLKTGQGNPPKGQAKTLLPRPKQPDKEQASTNKNHKTGPKNEKIPHDRKERLTMDKSQLPSDATFKGYREVVVQNLILRRDNVLYEVAQYYSKSENMYYSASLPPGYCGEFGAELRTVLQTLHNVCDVTEGSLMKLLESTGVQISSGSINNILLSQSGPMQQEKEDILQAGLENSPYVGLDGTKSFERGKRLSTQIICGEHFTVYSTQPGKSRLDILCAVQGVSRRSQLFAYNECTAGWLEHFDVGQKHCKLLENLFLDKPPFTMSDFIEQLDKAAPRLADSKAFERIADAFALGHYHTQRDFPIVQLLMSDQGKEYNGVAALAQAFCWLHDERHYRQLNPKLNLHRREVDDFLNKYWAFYRQLLDFKELLPAQQEEKKALLSGQFDQIFTQKTPYDNLNQQIQKTFAKKEQLLLVLEYPFLPLHNNAAELAVRQKVRKRDISMHTWSEKGTKTQDAFMTIVQTAVKLGVSAFDYIADRVSRRFNMTPLAELVTQAYSPVTLPL
jgi:hypothetical protein